MKTFVYRDARRQRLADALAAPGGATPDLKALLGKEQEALKAGDWTVADNTYLGVGLQWLWTLAAPVKAQVDDDPVLQALQTPATLSDAQAAAIDALPRMPGPPPTGFAEQVRAALDNNETAFRELLYAAHRRWILQPAAERPYPFDEVGVLLPLRLETLFDAPGSAENSDAQRWKLSLRVIPDEASICRDNAFVSAGELKALQAFWDAVRRPGEVKDSWLEGDKANVAWKLLADRVGAARAAWLTASIPLKITGDHIAPELPEDMPAAPQPNRVGGFPPELHIIATTDTNVNGQTKHTIGRLPEDKDRFIDPQDLLLLMPDRDMAEEKKKWWVSWEAARKAGLGGEFMLPAGITPQNIAALYVLGMGEETPQAHFRAHADAGDLALLRLGTPTNTVHGGATADAGDATDWRKVAQLRLRQRLDGPSPAGGAAQAVQRYLTGNADGLPFFAGADAPDDTEASRLMVQALWPALWGHYMNEVWQGKEVSFPVAAWAFRYLCPEGPLMPLRIGDQPYGLLPVTALAGWEPGAGFGEPPTEQQELEKSMAGLFNKLRPMWAAAVKDKRCIVGKPTAGFMEILAQDAYSSRYVWRTRLPADLVLAPLGIHDVLRREEFVSRVISAYKTGRELLGRTPAIPYVGVGYYHHNPLPLVKPTRWMYRHQQREGREPMPLQAFLDLLFSYGIAESLDEYALEVFMNRWRVWPGYGDYQLHTLQDSLLIRLMVYAAQLAHLWKRAGGITTAMQELLDMQQKAAFIIAEQIDADKVYKEEDPMDPLPVFALDMPDEKRLQLERALRATLDCAAHRIDAWCTGFAWQRLLQHGNSERRLHRMGVYGWVDGPFAGRPGPTDAGRLHAPSYNQALAALVLRDKYLSSGGNAFVNERGDTPWHMDITSPKARLAEELAEEVRLGFHIYEITGRRVENIIAKHQLVKELRISPKYAMRPERRDPREVCNGQLAMQGLLAGDPDFPLDAGQREALQLLADAMDTYGDLLMADGIIQLVNGQPERAAETMDAAAGFSRPPGFEFLQTPPSGYQLETVVLSALPYVPPAGPGEQNPVKLADPSVAAFVEAQLGGDWKWRALDAEGGALGEVTLAQLQLSTLQAVAIPHDLLCEMARRRLGLPGAQIAAPRQHGLALDMLAALGSRPAAGRDFTSEKDGQQAIDKAIYAELQTRYKALFAAGEALLNELRNAIAANNVQPEQLRRALAWGIATVNEAADSNALVAALLGTAPPPGATPLPALAKIMADTLENRLKAAPQPADLPPADKISAPLETHAENKRKNIPDGVPTLAQAIANLAVPGIRLAVLAAWNKTALRTGTRLVTEQTATALDEDWLTVVAAARGSLARLEALQLELSTPLQAWSSSPGDPWQKNSVAANKDAVKVNLTRFVAAYGNASAWNGEMVAAGIIDAFSEAIPLPQRATTTAFGFNAPAAKAPQAILLAVPPKPGQRLETEGLLQIVEETRELAHARTARLEDLPDIQPLAPAMWLQSSGPVRMRFERPPII